MRENAQAVEHQMNGANLDAHVSEQRPLVLCEWRTVQQLAEHLKWKGGQ